MFPFNKIKKRFNKSKKGFTLVEILASAFVLSIVFMGVLSAVAFSRQMVFTDNSIEKASDEAQLVADEIISLTYEAADQATATAAVTAYYSSDADKELKTSVSAFGYSGGATEKRIQYVIEEVGASAVDTDVSSGVTQTIQHGFKITVRVYYERINGQGGYDCVEITGFSPAQPTP